MDVVISYDTTGSMFPALAEVRRRVKEVIDQLFALDGMRVGLIAHGDYDDYPYTIKTQDLTTDKDKLIKFINTVETTQGFGNGGEAYGLVLKTARDLSWTSDKCVLIVMGDEPVHERGYIYTGSIRHKYYVDHDWREQAAALINAGISIYMVRCLDRSDSKAFHRELSEIGRTPLIHLHQFSNVVEMLYAIAYKTVGDEKLEAYGQELENTGKLNRNLASIIDDLLQGKTFSNKASVTVNHGNGLIPVDPTRFQVLHVDNEIAIKDFVEGYGIPYKKGRGFYKLTKREEIQENKEVILVHRNGDMFTGSEAREMIGLPYGMRDNRSPYNVPHGYTAFVQSTSVNRKLMPHTQFLYET